MLVAVCLDLSGDHIGVFTLNSSRHILVMCVLFCMYAILQ